jgi:hypothetical protein
MSARLVEIVEWPLSAPGFVPFGAEPEHSNPSGRGGENRWASCRLGTRGQARPAGRRSSMSDIPSESDEAGPLKPNRARGFPRPEVNESAR